MQSNIHLFMFKSRKQYSYEEVLTKLMGFCAYQERSPFEVKQKAINYGLNQEEATQIVNTLIEDSSPTVLRCADHLRDAISC